MSDFDHILNWKLKVGSHQFPGPGGGTCINEAAVVAAGFSYRRVTGVRDMPACFSRPICALAMALNDRATDEQRRRLLPFVTRLACADSAEIERKRDGFIGSRTGFFGMSFDEGLEILEGALGIGRQASPLGADEVRSRLESARPDPATKQPVRSKLKGWLELVRG
jgi:hypothetical protein